MKRYLLPREWLGRVIVAWLGGLVLALPIAAIADVRFFAAAFWSLVAILAAFALSDYLRSRTAADDPPKT